MRMSAMRRKTKVKTLRRRRAVLETVELEGEEFAISHSQRTCSCGLINHLNFL